MMKSDEVRIISNPGFDHPSIRALYDPAYGAYLLSGEPMKWTAEDIESYKKQGFINDHAPKLKLIQFPRC